MKHSLRVICLYLPLFFLGPLRPLLADNQNCTSSIAAFKSTAIKNEANAYVYLLIGKANAGKGTAGKPFARELGIPYRSTGDALRAVIDSGSELGQKIGPIIAAGKNIETADLMPVLDQWLGSLNPKLGFVLDGSPRKLNEAKDLERMLIARGWKGIRVIYFEISDKSVYERAAGRRICSNRACGQSYHDHFIPPQMPGICDLCDSSLKRRTDDESPEIVKERLATFELETRPVIDHFAAKSMLIMLNAELPQSEVMAQLWQSLIPK